MIKPCTVQDVLAPENRHLLEEYATESSIDGMPTPSAQLNTYKALEEAGVLRVLGEFSDYALIGYIVLLTSNLPHYGATVVISESFFVAKAHRKTGAGLRLLRAAERYAVEVKAVGFLVSAPFGGVLSKVLPRVGYKHTNEVFFRSILA